MVHVIAGTNWCQDIGTAIRNAADGDVIIVDSSLKAKLAEKSAKTICPQKRLDIQISAAA